MGIRRKFERNYWPNSFGGPAPDPKAGEPPFELSGTYESENYGDKWQGMIGLRVKIMNEPSKANGFTLRQATEQDMRQLSIHHRKMFEEIWEKKGQQIGNSASIEIEQAYSRKLSKELPAGSCRSWLIENGNQIVASGAITVVSLVPTPNDFSSKVAYLHSMYTEKAFRGESLANRIVRKALEYCRANGIKRVFLNASEAGRSTYERIGFSSSPEMMRIFIE